MNESNLSVLMFSSLWLNLILALPDYHFWLIKHRVCSALSEYRLGNIFARSHILLRVSTQLNILFSTLFNSILHHLRFLRIFLILYSRTENIPMHLFFYKWQWHLSVFLGRNPINLSNGRCYSGNINISARNVKIVILEVIHFSQLYVNIDASENA